VGRGGWLTGTTPTREAVPGRSAPGGQAWREALEALAPPDQRHLPTFEGHVTHMPDRDRPLLTHIDVKTMVGDRERIGRHPARMDDIGFREVIYTPTGPDVARELRAFATAYESRAALQLP